jgi:hypothetical protein
MYKNLLVHIPTERSAVDGSISLAMSCGAHLDAVAIGFENVIASPSLQKEVRPSHRLLSSSTSAQ